MSQALSESGKGNVILQMPERSKERLSISIREIPIAKISMSPFQTREILAEQDLESLSHSIKESGLLQPILVRMITRAGDLSEQYELVAGERRLRAARLAGLETIPVIVRDLDERAAAEASVIENAQRENLDPIEEARAFQQLMETFKLTQTEVAKIAGKDRSTVSNSIRLLQLDQRIQIFLRQGQLSAGHGRAILQLESRKQFRFAERGVREQLSVHALEKLVAQSLKAAQASAEKEEKDPKLEAALRRQEEKIGDLLKIEAVSLALDDEGRRHVKLTFESDASWKRFMRQLKS
jgi:ParB family chromosome partitioning protein